MFDLIFVTGIAGINLTKQELLTKWSEEFFFHVGEPYQIRREGEIVFASNMMNQLEFETLEKLGDNVVIAANDSIGNNSCENGACSIDFGGK